MSGVRIEKSVCLFCPPGCGIHVRAKGNEPVRGRGYVILMRL